MLAYMKSSTSRKQAIDRFLDVVRAGSCTMTFKFPDNLEEVSHSIDCVQMGDVNVLRYQGSGLQQCWRQREHILHDRTEYFIVSTPVDSRYSLRYGNIHAEAPPGSFVILSTARPFQCGMRELETHGSFAVLNVRVPASLVRRYVPRIDDLCGHFLGIQPGVSRAMQKSFNSALEDGAFMGEDDRRSVGASMIELMCHTANQLLGGRASMSVSQDSVQEQIMRKAKTFIEANLSNPELGPSMVADHCRVSTRYLHTFFTSSSEGLSCFRYIREQRLQRCHEALRNIELRHRYVMDIAADWGFFDPAGFTNLYKAKFGLTPGQERK